MNGRLKVTEWSGTCQGILFVERRSGWGESRRRRVLWKDRAEDFQHHIRSKKLRARPWWGEDDKEEVKGR